MAARRRTGRGSFNAMLRVFEGAAIIDQTWCAPNTDDTADYGDLLTREMRNRGLQPHVDKTGDVYESLT
jgi:hypothetical protein